MDKHLLTEVKLAVTAFFAALTAGLGTLALPVYLLVAMSITDYITGLAAAPYRGEKRSSQKGVQGIIKKICLWVLVGIGAAVDQLLAYTASVAGLALPFRFLVGAAVAVWLVCNEIISILENMGDIGAPLPGFLMTLIRWIQSCTEQKATLRENGESDGTKIDSAP